jgi:ferredoxin
LLYKFGDYDEFERKETLEEAQFQIKENLNFLNELPAYKKESFVKNIFSLIVFFLYHFVFRHVIGLSFVSSSKCVHCGWCAQNCPAKSIRFDKQTPHFNTGCIGCFRCVNACPVGAIDYSKYALITSAVCGVLGMMLIGSILSFFGIFAIIAGLLLGIFSGALIFQKCIFLFPKDKNLCFNDKKRDWFSDNEKDL